ncbi:hypothetical protein MKJ04_02075 [Pontibacter sp. E15-1]|uniref:hypothetical protein n=1 Tax=Pontibacter sp. E15-1 TaxID=2919918 RepID=UPI001F500430|nr:hypothetical protein [Pontibacter sp. E15-1]MCJ8163610.1 hypothetical protein [Pontibacter sp. E15-1]
MLVTIEQTRTNSPLDDFVNSMAENQLTFYASDLLQERGCDSIIEIELAVRRATEICNSMHLPLRENFKSVFRSRNGEVVQDWRLSPMAYMLMILNADPHHELVARMQVELVRRALNI